jgi:hypothetical protein
MPIELGIIVVVVASEGGILNGSVHPHDLSIYPRMHWLGQPMFDIEIGAIGFKGLATEKNTLDPHYLDICGRPAIARGVGEVRAIVRQNGVESVRNGLTIPPADDWICGRFVRWARRGVWENLFRALAGAGRSFDTQMIDSTHVKAHRSASGGKGGRKNRRSAVLEEGATRRCMHSRMLRDASSPSF